MQKLLDFIILSYRLHSIIIICHLVHSYRQYAHFYFYFTYVLCILCYSHCITCILICVCVATLRPAAVSRAC